MAADEALNRLEARVCELEARLKDIHQGVVGTIGEPGIAETLRRTVETLDKVKASTDTLLVDRWVLRGIALAMGFSGALIGWFVDQALKSQ